jgi:hypothetical protein
MPTQISTTHQHDLFDVTGQRWKKLPVRRRKDIETLLTQLFIQAIQEQSGHFKSGEQPCIQK